MSDQLRTIPYLIFNRSHFMRTRPGGVLQQQKKITALPNIGRPVHPPVGLETRVNLLGCLGGGQATQIKGSNPFFAHTHIPGFETCGKKRKSSFWSFKVELNKTVPSIQAEKKIFLLACISPSDTCCSQPVHGLRWMHCKKCHCCKWLSFGFDLGTWLRIYCTKSSHYIPTLCNQFFIPWLQR